MSRFAWAFLPVDQMSLPVAGLEQHERTRTMTYELAGFGAFGDEFAQIRDDIRRNAAASAPLIGGAVLRGATAVAKAPATIQQAAVIKADAAPAVYKDLAQPLVDPAVPAAPADAPDPCTVLHGPTAYTDARTGECAGVHAPPMDDMTKYVIGGGLIVAVGIAAYFSTRKGK